MNGSFEIDCNKRYLDMDDLESMELRKALAEIIRLRDTIEKQKVAAGSSFTTTYVTVFIFCGFTVAAIVAIAIFMPVEQGRYLMTSVIGLMTPTILSLIGYAIKQNHQLMNSRLTELLEERGKSQRAEGKLEGKAEEVNKSHTRDI